MAEQLKLITERDRHTEDARSLLLEAAEKGWTAVAVVGLTPDGTVESACSKSMNTTQLIGALELVKFIRMASMK